MGFGDCQRPPFGGTEDLEDSCELQAPKSYLPSELSQCKTKPQREFNGPIDGGYDRLRLATAIERERGKQLLQLRMQA